MTQLDIQTQRQEKTVSGSTPRPVFNVIIPTFNRAHFLSRAIQSTLSQTFENFELIIVDDASTDQTRETVESFDDERITYIRRDINGGVAAALNTGILQATGKYVTFLGDDDEYLPDFLEEVFHAFEVRPESVGFIWCGIRLIYDVSAGEDDHEEMVWQLEFQSSRQAYLPYVSQIGTGYGLTIKRACFDLVGLFDETLPVASDTDFILRLACNFDFAAIPKILINIYKHTGLQLTDPHYRIQRLDAHRHILQKNIRCLEKHPNLSREFHRRLIYYCYQLEEKVHGRRLMLKMIKKYPGRLDLWMDLVCFEIFKEQALVISKSILPEKSVSFLLTVYRRLKKMGV